jgi:hypothetical protein
MANTGNKYIIIYDKGEEKNQTVLCKDEKATATKEKELLENEVESYYVGRIVKSYNKTHETPKRILILQESGTTA